MVRRGVDWAIMWLRPAVHRQISRRCMPPESRIASPDRSTAMLAANPALWSALGRNNVVPRWPFHRTIRSAVPDCRHARKTSAPRLSEAESRHSAPRPAQGRIGWPTTADACLVSTIVTELIAAAGEMPTARYWSSGDQLSSAVATALLDVVALRVRTM